MILTIVIVLVVGTIVAALTLQYMRRSQQSTTMYDIASTSPPVALLNSDLPWNMVTPCSLRFAVNIESAPKTTHQIDCDVNTAATASASATEFVASTTLRQSCSDYSYTACQCTSASDCANCALPNNTGLTKLLWLGTSVNLYTSGYTSQSDKQNVQTLLTIKTAGNGKMYIETISLPAIPLQKWTVITIVQEGRRIDVYYGAIAVAGVFLKYPPVPANTSDMWFVGQMSGWKGEIGLFLPTKTSLTSNEVEQDVAQLVDTAGLPFAKSVMDFTFDFNLNMPSCIFGTCSGFPAIKPPNPFTVYASSVS